MCYQPITIKTPQGYRQVPCGKCLECLRKYQSDWSNRMYEELKAHDGKAVFFTLTYDEQNVPKNYLYYSTATDYEIFRSPSDYGYDNTYVDDSGKEKVLPSRRGERKHKRQDPDQEVKELGLDLRIIDFNIPRKQREKFKDQIQNIYGNYLRNINANPFDSFDSVLDVNNSSDFHYDFDEFEGDYFTDESVKEEQVIMLDLFEDVLEDEDKEEPTNTLEVCEKDIPHFRERPIMMFNSVRKKDVQDWIKRARQRRKRLALKNGTPEQTFSFFITSEYGPRTLRPHYHGVLFGVTAEEANDMKTDWMRHHGRKISWDNVDLSKGDMSYCAKYCSKGFYEHPLCAKDFFYYKPTAINDVNLRPFTEYHSKRYERCMEIFGIDAPIVDPTFHLVSKGLGVKWVEDHQDLVKDFKDIDFKDGDVESTIKVAYTPSYSTPTEDFGDPPEFSGVCSVKEGEIIYDLSILKDVSKEDEHVIKRIKHELKTKDYEECIERLFNNFKYYRTYKGEVVPYGVPKYYRTKIFSDGLRAAFTNYIQQINVELYQEKFEQLRASNPDREDAEIVFMLEREDQQEKYNRMRECKKKLDKVYNKSKI